MSQQTIDWLTGRVMRGVRTTYGTVAILDPEAPGDVLAEECRDLVSAWLAGHGRVETAPTVVTQHPHAMALMWRATWRTVRRPERVRAAAEDLAFLHERGEDGARACLRLGLTQYTAYRYLTDAGEYAVRAWCAPPTRRKKEPA